MVLHPLDSEQGWWVRAFTPIVPSPQNDEASTREIHNQTVDTPDLNRPYQPRYPVQVLNDSESASQELIEELRKDNLLELLIEEGREGHELEACILIVRHWLGECWNHHQICQSEPEGWVPELPSRLIYLGELHSTTVEEIKIIDTEHHTNFQYIAVSYRWPMYLHPSQQLNEHTRDAFYRGYPVSRLHPLYADTFKVAAMLGIKYVWIDALCILQGTDQDWRAEASKVASVYGNSVFTLAYGDGTEKPDLDLGYPSYCESCRLDDAVQAASRPFLEGKLTEYDRRSPEALYSWLEANENFPTRPEGEIDRRGWAFQERLLSKRILSVTKSGFFWDCCSLNAADCRPLGLRGDFSPKFRDLEERRLKTLLLTGNVSREVALDSDMYLLWRRIIEKYSHRNFTFDRDRLVALEGVVQRFQTLVREPCFLGMWKGDVLRSLVWFRDTEPDDTCLSKSNHHPPELHVPSWCWASVESPIGYRLWHPYQRYAAHNVESVSLCASLEGIDARLPPGSFSTYTGTVSITGPLTKTSPAVLVRPGCKVIRDLRPTERFVFSQLQYVYILPILKAGYSANLQAYYCLLLIEADLDMSKMDRTARSRPDPDMRMNPNIKFERIGLFVVDCATRHNLCFNDPFFCRNEECKKGFSLGNAGESTRHFTGEARCLGRTRIVRIV
ncbi:unnamed protein product [Clonostachys rosea]|uniref:Heterokaryon incompatibility domain-containing protein n=1 Tax=Bionectria ochroleuca TaxID=29856 RepID=A0ABY6U3M5_BIOOC|nr:unnamed protein product [Clonostachys rosea]